MAAIHGIPAWDTSGRHSRKLSGKASRKHTVLEGTRRCLSEDTIQKLEDRNIPISVGTSSAYRTDKRPVRMEYLDDIDIPEFREIPTYKRMCVCILKNDHACKYMGFALTKREKQLRELIMEKYRSLEYGKV